MDLRHFVERRPALYRVAFRITERFPAVKRWLLLRLTRPHGAPAQVTPQVAPASDVPSRAVPQVPPMTASEVDYVSYLLRRAIEAKRRD